MRVLLIIVATLAACSSLADLPSNGGFEKTGRAGDAVGWEPLVMGAPAEFSLDPATHKSGARSMKISAAEITRAYAVSDFMPVSAGERFTATAWVLQTNVPSGKGTVIAIAEFCDSEERQTSVSKIGIADSSKQDWQLVSGSASVPDGAAFLRLRLGFSYSQGTCWWDDVRVKFAGELAARFDVPHGRLTPAREGVEVIVLNRAGLTDHVGLQIESSSSGPATVPVKLTGEPLQRVRVPMTFQKPGKLVLKGSIFKTNSAVACRFAAQVAVPPPLGLEPLVPTHWTVEDGAGRIEGRAHLALPAAELTAATLKVRLMNSDGKLAKAREKSPRRARVGL